MTSKSKVGEKVKKTLLEIAKTHVKNRKIKITHEEVELAVAWAKDEVSTGAVEKALGVRGYGIYSRLALALARYVREQVN